MNVIVMGGCGQVGKALVDIIDKKKNKVYILDQKDDMRPSKDLFYEFLHVTIPYSMYFLQAVRIAIRTYEPKYIVIHSTVPVGTTRRFGDFAAHSPVRGQHNDLENGIFNFPKYVGAYDEKTRTAVVAHLRASGIPAEGWRKPEETELNKLLCLSRYLNDISFCEVAFRLSRRFNVAPSRFVQWTNSYNDGYHGTKWVRPELIFPMGKVGGHCVMPVSKMLVNQTRYDWLKRNVDLFEKRRHERTTH